MAKTTAPILSFNASGSIAKTVVFGKFRGISYARSWVKPANPQSTAQTETRTTFATLREMWKRAPALAQAPWDSYAQGRAFTGMNAYVGENMRLVRGDADMQDFIGSPGAKGGLSFSTFAAVAGAGTGEIDVTLTAPTLPDGWAITNAHALAFPDFDPATVFAGPFVAGSDAAAPYEITLTGLGSAVLCVVAGWFEYTKPNGETAYSVGLTTTATTGA